MSQINWLNSSGGSFCCWKIQEMKAGLGKSPWSLLMLLSDIINNNTLEQVFLCLQIDLFSSLGSYLQSHTFQKFCLFVLLVHCFGHRQFFKKGLSRNNVFLKRMIGALQKSQVRVIGLSPDSVIITLRQGVGGWGFVSWISMVSVMEGQHKRQAP